MAMRIDRRRLLLGATGAAGALLLAGCDRLTQKDGVKSLLAMADDLNLWLQRLLGGRRAMAPEYEEADLSPAFRANGTIDPQDAAYRAMAANGFADWRLEVGGLVERPMRFSLADLRAMASRTQITRHDCVEGWSCIGKWTGVPLGAVLERVGVKPAANYVVFHCADPMYGGSDKYYESIDFDDAYHPQTILAYEMNGQTLPVPHGAPLRVRIERQLGYKMAKYIMRIELVDSFAGIGGGNGGYWEDRDYAWYAGI